MICAHNQYASELTMGTRCRLQSNGVEAADLLETLVAGPPEADSTDEIKDTSDPKVEALQRWLDAVRLASERLKT